MKNKWLNFLTGMVEVEVKGFGAERIINDLSRKKIVLFNMRKLEKEHIIFIIKLDDLSLFRQALRHKELKVHFRKRIGLPFLIRSLLKSKGLILGAAAFLVTVFILSNIVWAIRVDGASIETELKIRKSLDQLNVKVGKFNFREGNVEAIQKYIMNRVPTITWIGIRSEGAIYHLQVVEKKLPKIDTSKSFNHIVAARKALIVQTLVETGQVKVIKHQLVKKGQLLVSGLIGTEDKPKFVGAKGVILGETWYQTTSEAPLQTEIDHLTGKQKQKIAIKLFNWTIPIWGFGKSEFAQTHQEKTETNFHFWKWKLPLGLVSTQIFESKKTKVTRTQDEAVAIARENARNDLLEKLPAQSQITKENILQKKMANGKVILKIHYEVIEDIALGKNSKEKVPDSSKQKKN